jgi:long-chain acyl-CoA synthetase
MSDPPIPPAFPEKICDIVQPWAERSPDHPALVDASGTWTYRELADVIAKAQAWLEASGVRPGDRVMIVGENCRAFAALLFAVAKLDAWPVPVNAHLSAREIDIIRDHCGARRVLFTTGVSTDAAAHAQRHGAVNGGPDELGMIALGPLRQDVASEPLDATISNRVGALIYTSGTTGLPKGVALSHRNLLFTAAGAAKLRTLTPEDRVYGVLPLSHVVGLSTNLLGALLSGGTLYLPERFDPMTARVALEKERISILLGVPAMFVQFLRYAKMKRVKTLRFPALRIISASGAPLEASVKSEVEALLGLTLHHGYGITECSPNIAQTRVDAPSSDTSVGQPFPGVEIKIVGGDGKPAEEGEVGEVRVRGPNIMKGYYRDPEATAAAVDSDGWFNTRDLGRFESGRLYLVGRGKDLIIRSGFNVYPVEVEAVLNAHPAIVQSAVISGPVEGDEEIIAFVQPDPDATVTPRELAEYAAKHLAPYKRPSRILFIATMPLTPTGKIVKGDLAKLLAEGAISPEKNSVASSTVVTQPA